MIGGRTSAESSGGSLSSGEIEIGCEIICPSCRASVHLKVAVILRGTWETRVLLLMNRALRNKFYANKVRTQNFERRL